MRKRGHPFSIGSRLESVRHAFRGVRDMLATERNAWVHLVATVLVLDFAWWLEIDRIEMALIIIVIVIVWAAEAFNTVLEIMADLVVGQRYSRLVKRAKDISAAAVLIAALGAAGVGLVILGPPLYHRLFPLFA